MSARENYIIAVAGLVFNAKTQSETAFAANFNEARVLASVIATDASMLRLADVVSVTRDLRSSLGHFDDVPHAGLGPDIVRLASQVGRSRAHDHVDERLHPAICERPNCRFE